MLPVFQLLSGKLFGAATAASGRAGRQLSGVISDGCHSPAATAGQAKTGLNLLGCLGLSGTRLLWASSPRSQCRGAVVVTEPC